ALRPRERPARDAESLRRSRLREAPQGRGRPDARAARQNPREPRGADWHGVKLELVCIPTPTIPLDGLYYEPDGGATAGGVLLFHGNTMNFYVGAPSFLPPALKRLGFACLAFNRR